MGRKALDLKDFGLKKLHTPQFEDCVPQSHGGRVAEVAMFSYLILHCSIFIQPSLEVFPLPEIPNVRIKGGECATKGCYRSQRSILPSGI